MKVAISVQGGDLSAAVDPRFGRARGFLIFDSETGEFEYLDNPNIDAAGGAGIQTSQMVVDRGSEAVITGNVGPNAYRVLDAAGIDVFTGASGTAEEALADYKAGKLNSAGSATVEEKFGMGSAGPSGPGTGGSGVGSGGGRGMGRGGGRGMGRGGGGGGR
ncbi:MAG: NifB/NifX family molybdenum-iron cluster-binding protein [Actinobacteria bacterium]|nr:NifB/NifX family molybdenum-iron cluster-binding protein [Actinomycetota bacterium]MBU1943508.1 NifB/NifX family molybdenum-iron cluster-binding protein [Actinomycetota bacterium]MBU2686475.1 NifB/NifX family molybdenum-iron cluster-binding protein [Actinomycetota bacterium]